MESTIIFSIDQEGQTQDSFYNDTRDELLGSNKDDPTKQYWVRRCESIEFKYPEDPKETTELSDNVALIFSPRPVPGELRHLVLPLKKYQLLEIAEEIRQKLAPTVQEKILSQLESLKSAEESKSP